MNMKIVGKWTNLFGEDPHPASHGEKLLSALGAFLGILGVMVVSHGVLEPGNRTGRHLHGSLRRAVVCCASQPHVATLAGTGWAHAVVRYWNYLCVAHS